MNFPIVCVPFLVLVHFASFTESVEGVIIEAIKQLGSEDYHDREAASSLIANAGFSALSYLHKEANNPDLEVRRRTRELIALIEHQLRDAALKSLRRNNAVIVEFADEPGVYPSIGLFNSAVPRDVLNSLKHIKELKHLYLNCRILTDDDLVFLRDMTSLLYLNIDGASVTDDGLKYLSSLHQLRSLSLANSLILGSGLRHLKHLRHLESLSLKNSSLTDNGIEAILELQCLRQLDLSGTRISDGGVVRLQELSALRELDLRGISVSPESIDFLTEKCPSLHITR